MTLFPLSVRAALRLLLTSSLVGPVACGSDHPGTPPPTADAPPSAQDTPAGRAEDSASGKDTSGARPQTPVPSDAGRAPLTTPDPTTQTVPTHDADAASSAQAALSADAGPDNGGVSPTGDASTQVEVGGSAISDAISTAYAALTRGDRKAIGGVVTALDAARNSQPNDGYTALFAGTMRLWKMAEGATELGDLLQTPSLPDEIVSNLEQARALSPGDFRVPGFLGLAQVSVGRLSSDQTTVKKGLVTLDEAIVQFPAYGHFLRAASTVGMAKDDPLFSQGLNDLIALTKECLFDEGDAETAYVYPHGPTEPPISHVCLDEGIVPHIWEGIFITFGDVALKAGWSTPRVQALYRSAQTAPAHARWPFAPLLEQRIANAEENAQAYADANPLNDPGLWISDGHICTGCHQDH